MKPSVPVSPVEGCSDGPTMTSRRDLLRLSGAGALAVGLSPLVAAASHRPGSTSKSPDVVVIGGGYSGVTAARDLQLRGMDVLLLEARNRLGGRTFSTKFGNEHAELGGTVVHWYQPHVWTEIMRYGLELVDNTPHREGSDVLLMAEDGVHRMDPVDFFVRMDAANGQFFADSAALIPRPYEHHLSEDAAKFDHMSAADRLRELKLERLDHDLMSAVLNTYFLGKSDVGAYTELLLDWTQSGRNTAQLAEVTTKWAFKDGTISLLDAMVKDAGLEVRLSSPVVAVRQGEKGVEVVVEDGRSINCRYVVVTVPVNTLGHIEFTPGLNSSKQDMARERHACLGQKVYIKVKGVFNHNITAGAGQPLASVWPVAWNGTESTTLVGYTCGPVKGFSPHDRNAVQAFLAKFVPTVEVIQTLSYDWLLDPYSLGAHSLFRKGQYTRHLRGLRAREGKLFFAGDLLASGWRGYIDGAIESGMRAAREVMAVAQSERPV